jgi:hypothetical protein
MRRFFLGCSGAGGDEKAEWRDEVSLLPLPLLVLVLVLVVVRAPKAKR